MRQIDELKEEVKLQAEAMNYAWEQANKAAIEWQKLKAVAYEEEEKLEQLQDALEAEEEVSKKEATLPRRTEGDNDGVRHALKERLRWGTQLDNPMYNYFR